MWEACTHRQAALSHVTGRVTKGYGTLPAKHYLSVPDVRVISIAISAGVWLL